MHFILKGNSCVAEFLRGMTYMIMMRPNGGARMWA